MPVSSKRDFLLLYGSQTGQAEAISEEIFDIACKQGYKVARFVLGDIDKKFSIEKETCVVIVCSTTGEGEPPDNASKFLRRIKRKTLPSSYLEKLNYTFLGLGDSNYTNFCECGKTIEARLRSLGAKCFYEVGFADDAVGLERVVEPWIEGLFPSIKKHLSVEQLNKINTSDIIGDIIQPKNQQNNKMVHPVAEMSVRDNVPSLKYSAELEHSALKIPSLSDAYLKIEYVEEQITAVPAIDLPNGAKTLFTYPISKARSLTKDFDRVKHAIEVEFDLSESTWDYQPGDSFGIVCENTNSHVEFILQRLGLKKDADKPMKLCIIPDTKKKAPKIPTHIPSPNTIKNILKTNVDIRAVPRKAFLRMLSEYTDDTKEKRRLQELSSTQGGKDYEEFIRKPLIGFIDILQTFKSCQPPFERVLEYLPRLLPREYSVASSPLWKKNHVTFVFNVIEHPDFNGEKRFGLCTKWLEEKTKALRSEDITERIDGMNLDVMKVKAYLRKPTSFRFPDDVTRPLIMIGPGTGVAPYIGFLQQRQILRNSNEEIKLGEAWLFYGCRHEDADFLYKDDLHEYLKTGVLDHLLTSFSRDQASEEHRTRYVQENVKKHKDVLLEAVFNKAGAVFICGDAKHMGRDVTNLFIQLIEENKNVSKIEATKILNELRDKKQFLEDVWT